METYNYTYKGKDITVVVRDEDTNETYFTEPNDGLILKNKIGSVIQVDDTNKQVKIVCLEYDTKPNGDLVPPFVNTDYVIEPDEYVLLDMVPPIAVGLWMVKNALNGRLNAKHNHRVFGLDGSFKRPIEFTVAYNDPNIEVTVVEQQGGETVEYSFDGGVNWQSGNTFAPGGSGTFAIAMRYENEPGLITQTESIVVE